MAHEKLVPPQDYTPSWLSVDRCAEILDKTETFDLRSPISGRNIGISLNEPIGFPAEGTVLAYYPFASNVQKGIQPWVATVEATKMPLIGIEMPGHGGSFAMSREEAHRFSQGDVEWYTDEVFAALSEFRRAEDLPDLSIGIGMSAGATFISQHAKDNPGTFDKLVLFDPANLSKRSSLRNLGSYIAGQLFNKDRYSAPEAQSGMQESAAAMTERPGIHDWRYGYLVFGKTAVNGAVTTNINHALAHDNELEVVIYYAGESENVTSEDLSHLHRTIAINSAKRRDRLILIELPGETHHFDRNAFRIGEMARIAVSDI